MDPNATLDRIIDAFLFNDTEELYWASEDLYGWMHRGGFAPNNEELLKKFEETFKLPFSMDALIQIQGIFKR